MDKSGRRFVVHFQLIEQPKNLAEKTNQKTRNYNLDLSSQRGHARRYGSPRVSQALRQDGIDCGENRVARLMRENELAARRKQTFRPRTTVPGNGAVPNLIKDLEPSGVDQVWVSDITYVATVEGWLYLAVIMDLFSRKVVGWKLL